MNPENINITIEGLTRHYKNNELTPRELVNLLRSKADEKVSHNIWIHRLTEAEIEPYLNRLEKLNQDEYPLWGIPFAIKDNIDLAGVPTTAGCRAFTYVPQKHSFVVEQLIQAGAIPIGKTNMDQFATGLVGTRSPDPWGVCKNAFDDNYISGGSSSGSAVAVALGLVSFSLGTDTAGSGRVPAAFNNIVGLKPTKGLLSTAGVVPACKSLDVVSIFALTAYDAENVFNAAAQYDDQDPYSRKNILTNSSRMSGVANASITIGVPQKNQLAFYGDTQAESDFNTSRETWKNLGASLVEVDFSPFLHAAKLLYEGPWVTERYIAIKVLLENNADAVHPVVREIIEQGCKNSAEDTFSAQYRLQALKKLTDQILADIDLLITPTTGTTYSIDDVLANPIELNSRLGYYTNFMNLLDYTAIALPNAEMTGAIPGGFTLFSGKYSDKKLLAWAKTWQKHTSSQLGNTNLSLSDIRQADFVDQSVVNVVVCGAHLEGEPLNWQLTEREAILIKKTTSAPHYRLYALADGKRPGMERNLANGVAVDVEVWKVPSQHFGSFVANIPAPLGIGKIELLDGSWESGFICEGYGLEGALDISEFGGWRAYRAHQHKNS